MENVSPEVGSAEPAAPIENPSEETRETPVSEPQVNPAEVERARASEILTACRSANLQDLAPDFISRGVSVDECRKQLIEKLAQGESKIMNVQIVRDENETRSQAIENALLSRADSKIKLIEPARRYRSSTLVDLARECLNARGERVEEMTRSEIATRALMGSSDFPKILANVAAKSLRNAYQTAPQDFRKIVREVEANDFKPVQRTQMGGVKLDKTANKIAEKGTYTEGTLPEASEEYSLETYGKILHITRQAIINDDMQAFTRLPGLYGRACADLENDLVMGILTGNPVMGDTKTLFHANHLNIGTGAALSLDSLTEARKMMRLQKGLAGENLNLMPRFLVVPAALETLARKLITSINPVAAADVNPFGGSLDLIVDPRLDDNSSTEFYLVADPAQIDTIELAYLSGERGVFIEPFTEYTTDGFKLKVRLDVAAAPIDHRGFLKNTGVGA